MIDIFKDMRFSINSKDVTQGTVFVALKGKNTDGHLFVDEALKNGAEYVVVEKSLGFTNDRIIRVNSTLKFLAELARKRLEEFNPLVIGITGSNGKTTMKELLCCLLSHREPFKNRGNMNTEIGLPLSIINDYHGEEIAILEMAMNKRGDIAYLCEIAKPYISVLLNVGTAHQGVAGSLEDILLGKLEIVKARREHGFSVVMNDERLLSMLGNDKVVTFGPEKSDYALMDYHYTKRSTRASYMTPKGCIKVVLNGIWHRGHLLSLAASLAVLDLLKEPFVSESLTKFSFPKGRFNIVDFKGVKIIDDTYNASIESFRTAIDAIKAIGNRSYAVVGSIKEQGPYSEQTHRLLGQLLEALDGIFVYNTDEEINALQCSKELLRSKDPALIVAELGRVVKRGDSVLFKASRAVKMEKVLQMYMGGVK